MHTFLEYGASKINFIPIIIKNWIHAMQCVEGISLTLVQTTFYTCQKQELAARKCLNILNHF